MFLEIFSTGIEQIWESMSVSLEGIASTVFWAGFLVNSASKPVPSALRFTIILI